MATALHTSVRFPRPNQTARNRLAARGARGARNLVGVGAATLLTVPWLLCTRLMTADEMNGLFGNEEYAGA